MNRREVTFDFLLRGETMDRTNALLKWYAANQRDLPWRHTNDPYAILVSEMMLQQTTVQTVLKYYQTFMTRFPELGSLAAADEEAVLNAWKGLGYYSRARNLRLAAMQIAERHAGQFPRDYQELLRLPGVGPYVAGAVMSIAFGEPCPAVDGNVLRVMARLDNLKDDISRLGVRKEIVRRVEDMIPERGVGTFTQAMMELGALVCRPVSPGCENCPLKSMCAAYSYGTAGMLPVKSPGKKQRLVELWAIVIEAPGAVLLEHRKAKTLLANMWGVPVIEKRENTTMEDLARESYSLEVQNAFCAAGHVSHVFTHQRWEIDVMYGRVDEAFAVSGDLEWIAWEQLNEKPIPTAFQKVLKTVACAIE